MSVLNKNRILDLAENHQLLGEDYVKEYINGSSYDLRIGTIFCPKKENEDVEIVSLVRKNKRTVTILPSQIVTILTLEHVKIPNNLSATVFAINKWSSKGLLILNPGHIDPGYIGPISICAINLSNDTFELSLKEKIFTIIFDLLTEPTDEYKKNSPLERFEYENKFYSDRAKYLSSGIFDLFTINKYVPIFKKQINDEINNKVYKNLMTISKYLIGFAGIVGGIIAIISFLQNKTINILKDELNNKKIENEQIQTQLQDKINKQDTIIIGAFDSINSLNNILNQTTSKAKKKRN